MAARIRLLIAAPALVLLASAAAAQSCRQAVGAAEAQRFVAQCIQVSPATHPPCNAENPCDLITDEIRRGCGLLGADAPSFCRAYQRH
ncbi:MAG: hypothetical protein U1E70_21980 [Acetobacteraceae bacterium]